MAIKRPGPSEHQHWTAVSRPDAARLAMRTWRLVQRAMAEIAPDWAVELEGICTEEATLVVVPEDGDDAIGPSFVISRETYGLRVDQVHWDALTEVGVFASLARRRAALRRLAASVLRSGAACRNHAASECGSARHGLRLTDPPCHTTIACR